MTQTHYSLSWARDFKNNICSGFSALQQNGEFVDMTIAADGHFVKVHQVIVALASPYLKNLMASAPCQHPIIFLNKIPHKVLCYLLQYIYTGEVVVPSEYLASFTDAAKELCIIGLEGVGDYTESDNIIPTTIGNTDISELSSKKRKKNIDLDHTYLPRTAKKLHVIKSENVHMSVNQNLDTDDGSQDYSMDMMDDTKDDDEEFTGPDSTPANIDQVKEMSSSLLYSLSIRGALQVILNRYVYNLNSSNSRNGVRRWRCVHYRDKKCNAYVVTKGNTVINRSHLHNHPFHDKKILDKIEKKAIFSALDDVEAYAEKEKAKIDKEDDSFDHVNDTSGEL